MRVFYKIVWLIGLLFITKSLYCQSLDAFAGAQRMGLANCGGSITSSWSVIGNPAAGAHTKEITISTAFRNLFFTQDLNQASISLLFPCSVVNIGIGYSHYIVSNYTEGITFITTSRTFSPKLSMGLGARYMYQNSIENISIENYYALTLGILYSISPHINIGINGLIPINKVQSDWNRYRIESDITFNKIKDLICYIHLFWDTLYNFKVGAAIEYLLVKSCYLRVGTEYSPLLFAGGIGYTWHKITLDFGYTHHHILGGSPSISVTYKI